MTSVATERLPTNRLPPLQRPTPSREIRLHLDTYDELKLCKPPSKSFDAWVRYLLDHWKDGQEARVRLERAL